MLLGTGHKICSQKDENYVSESTALWRVKYLSVLSPFSGDKVCQETDSRNHIFKFLPLPLLCSNPSAL
jgi:hypothetical protein